MTTITVHSFKGGTGKSLISVVLAYFFSNEGSKTLLIDGDYSAPCLDAFFPTKKMPFTSFLQGECKLKQSIADTGMRNLSVSHAPAPSFREELLRADVKTHGMYLKRILEGIEEAKKNLGFDVIIFDNSSGITLPSINQLTCSNRSVIVLRPVHYGIQSTYEQIDTIYKKLRYADGESARKDYLVWNQVPVLDDDSMDERVVGYLNEWIKKFEDAGIHHGATIPYISEVVTSMIGLQNLDVEHLAEQLKDYVLPLKEKIV